MCLPSVLTLFIFPWSGVTWTSVGLFFKVQISLCVLNLQFQVFENFQNQKSLWVFQIPGEFHETSGKEGLDQEG